MQLRDWLIRDEGLRYKPYKDSVGKITIGVGRNLTDVGLSLEEIYYLLENDIERCKGQLISYSWYTKQPPGVKDALINMCFNLGLEGLLAFRTMIRLLDKGKYQDAAEAALDSSWAKQVPERAKQITHAIALGK